MSKICEKCGNMIPDTADVCPGCGRGIYNDEALAAMMNDAPGSRNQKVEPVRRPAVSPQAGDTQVFRPETVKKEAAAARAAKKASAPNQNVRKTPSDGGKPREMPTDARRAAGQSAEKQKKRNESGSAVLGIIIGLIVALLLVAGVAGFMLYKMGFFEFMSDDMLLQTESQTSVVDTIPSQIPSPSPVVEESLVEESVAEEPEEVVVPESSVEEPVEPEDTVDVTKFLLTGADDMTFYSRGETAQIVYVIAPEEAQLDIEWTSSDETVASVSNLGVISARRGGKCTITGTCGDFEVSVAVNCNFTVPTTVLDMNYEDITMDHEGQTVWLKIDFDLSEDQIKAIRWETTDESIATVDDEGLVTAIGDGTAVISASIADYTASCIVRCVNVTGNKGVNSDESEYVINYEDVTLSRKGEYFELTLKSILGEEVPEFTWTSSDKSVATVDDKGIVTAVADGTCKITTSIGKDDFECIVRVRISG